MSVPPRDNSPEDVVRLIIPFHAPFSFSNGMVFSSRFTFEMGLVAEKVVSGLDTNGINLQLLILYICGNDDDRWIENAFCPLCVVLYNEISSDKIPNCDMIWLLVNVTKSVGGRSGIGSDMTCFGSTRGV